MTTFMVPALVLGIVGAVGALLLYFVSRWFRVEEDPRIAEVVALLPGANCGGCGCSGCHDFAVKCAGAETLDGLNCPGAGAEAMKKIASIVGLASTDAEAKVAQLKCNGCREARKEVARYDGVARCSVVNITGIGAMSCSYGCLGCGDCVSSCRFGAIYIDENSGLPAVDSDKCTGCGVCATACPRGLIELRSKGPRGLRVWVACSSRDKGGVARQKCANACIGCSKCVSVCPFGAIAVNGNVAYIDASKCKACRKCVAVCPVGAIHVTNMPRRAESEVSDRNKD